MKTRCVVLLQNAWSPWFARTGRWPRESWLAALAASPTGKTLARIFPNSANVHFDNTTQAVGETASSLLPPDEEHVLRVLHTHNPEFVLSCGKQAGEVAQLFWEGRLVAIPHPAWRLFSTRLAEAVRDIIERDQFGRIIVTTNKDKEVVVVDLLARSGVTA